MALELNGTTGVSLVQDGVLTDANMPAGSVLQVIQGTYTSTVSISTTTFTDTGLSASITPSSTSSKILVLIDQLALARRNARSQGYGFRLLRDSTNIYDVGPGGSLLAMYRDINIASITGIEIVQPMNTAYLDSPSTTSSITYKTQIACGDNTSGGVINVQGYAGTSVITLMEVAA